MFDCRGIILVGRSILRKASENRVEFAIYRVDRGGVKKLKKKLKNLFREEIGKCALNPLSLRRSVSNPVYACVCVARPTMDSKISKYF